MKALRTPDERFADLPGFPFGPNYVEIDDLEGGTLRVHYLDEGPSGGPVVLLLHGEPSWSYLYRHMIPELVAAGLRCIVPDLVGFGRSDKPSEQDDYTYERHVRWMAQVVFERLDLRDIWFFGQDWGGLIGLRLVAEQPERYRGIVVGNTGLPTGERPPTEAFLNWQRFAASAEQFPIGFIVNGGTTTELPAEFIAAYDAPFPDDSYKAGARRFPALVPTSPDDPAHDANVDAWKVLEAFEGPVVCAFSDSDPITKGGERVFLALPGAAGQPHTTIEGAGHFLQEDRGPAVARVIVDLVSRAAP
jgi:haloalkane dehalogenase